MKHTICANQNSPARSTDFFILCIPKFDKPIFNFQPSHFDFRSFRSTFPVFDKLPNSVGTFLFSFLILTFLWFRRLLTLYAASRSLFGMGGLGPVLLMPMALPIGAIQYLWGSKGKHKRKKVIINVILVGRTGFAGQQSRFYLGEMRSKFWIPID